MQYTIEALLNGNEKLLEYFKSAKDKWRELFEGKTPTVESWAAWVTEQHTAYFDKECGGNLLGHEVMVLSGFGTLYSTQFGWRPEERQKAEMLLKAIDASHCGEEVKKAAVTAAQLYALVDTGSSRAS